MIDRRHPPRLLRGPRPRRIAVAALTATTALGLAGAATPAIAAAPQLAGTGSHAGDHNRFTEVIYVR